MATHDADLYVSPDGDDGWSGERAEPGEDDGPFETIERAQRAVRERREAGRLPNDPTVVLRGGTYRLEEPLTFGERDAPVTYAAYPGEAPVVSGGRRIDGWEETTVNGVDAWTTTIPAVRDGDWYFRSLFVDGERRPRPRLPEEGFYRVADVPYDSDGFRTTEPGEGYAFDGEPGTVGEWHRLEDVEAVVPHHWFAERTPLEAVEPERDRLRTQLRFHRVASPGDRYRIENVFEALSDPGEWYLDRGSGELWYVPREGEAIDDVEVVAPTVHQLLRVEGAPGEGAFVRGLAVEGIAFRHADWTYPGALPPDLRTEPREGRDYVGQAACAQAEYAVPGTVTAAGARGCSFVDCTVEHVGLYGLQFAEGCTDNRVVGCEFADLGAGGIKIEGRDAGAPDPRRTGRNRVTDCHVHDGGRALHAAVGVLVRNSSGNDLVHNEICDLHYGGISCGWTWGFGDCVDRGNRIEANHVHGVTGEMVQNHHMGIYTLGVQPGTVIRENLVHDVGADETNGGGLHLDEGTSHVLVEDNVVFEANQPLNLHYGALNTVVNNVFVDGRNTQLSGVSRYYPDGVDTSITAYRNVFVSDGAPVLAGDDGLTSDNNVLWDAAGEVTFAREKFGGDPLSLEEWRERGNDRGSVVADPRIERLDDRGVAFADDAPALDLGFEPPDPSAGPRPPDRRE